MPLPGHFSFGRVPEGKVWGSPCFILGVRLRLKVGPGPAQEVVCAAPTDLEIKNRWPSGLTSPRALFLPKSSIVESWQISTNHTGQNWQGSGVLLSALA